MDCLPRLSSSIYPGFRIRVVLLFGYVGPRHPILYYSSATPQREVSPIRHLGDAPLRRIAPAWAPQFIESCNFIFRQKKRENKAPSTRIRIFLNPQLFLSGYGYRPHAYGEFASESGNFWIRTPEWKFLNPITFRIRVDGRIRIFSDTMTSQGVCRGNLNSRYGRRSKANSFCAALAYF